MKRIILPILLSAVSVPATMSALATDPYTGSRVFWDVATEKTVFDGAIYSRMAFEVAHYDGTSTVSDIIPDAQPYQSWTWMDVRILEKSDASVDEIPAVISGHKAKVSCKEGEVTISGSHKIASLHLYDIVGADRGNISVNANSVSFPAFSSFGVCVITYSDGSRESVKI
ncbi:MAG: hypothetical protein K2K97_05135 [Muribaculaceae bacterium]|nr:hypothetical protein [Muribaculaceae bacterium]